jgi:sterigmatocystin 8-O-methyltransferase
MAGHYNTPLDEPIETIFPFSTLNRNSLVVDVGGGNGQHSLRLAAKFPGMRFVVQDHTSVIESAQGTVPAAIAGRIQWQLQDMYSPQQVKGADIYLLSHVLMDNTNEYETFR